MIDGNSLLLTHLLTHSLLLTHYSLTLTHSLPRLPGIVLPIAIIILGTQVKSYRHMFVALVNLLCTLLLAFAWLVPISDSVAINPFAPSIMMSLGIAISFDYSLFMLTRYRLDTHSLTHSYSLTYSPTLTHSPTHSPTHSLTHLGRKS